MVIEPPGPDEEDGFGYEAAPDDLGNCRQSRVEPVANEKNEQSDSVVVKSVATNAIPGTRDASVDPDANPEHGDFDSHRGGNVVPISRGQSEDRHRGRGACPDDE